MVKILYLTKAIIRDFRSIKKLHINNIGDITVFVGANEAGKSNILKALNWFGNDEPLGDDDIPIESQMEGAELKKPIVELYFKVMNNNAFTKRFKSLLVKEVNGGFVKENGDNVSDSKDIDKILNNVYYLKMEKYKDGEFKVSIYDENLADVTEKFTNWVINILNISFSDIFTKIFEDILKKELKVQNIPDNQILNGINTIKNHSNFTTHFNLIINEMSSINTDNTEITIEDVQRLNEKIQQIVNNIPNSNASYPVGGMHITLNPHNIFMKTYNKVRDIPQYILPKMRPNFEYLSEEMELECSIPKGDYPWSTVLREDPTNEKYIINSRLIKLLGIDLEEFDSKGAKWRANILDNASIKFSKILQKSWKQLNISTEVAIGEDNIMLFKIIEKDKDNNKIKSTYPNVRSRGFKWYLSYLITLEYMKIKSKEEDVILLLDDPAVYLHENGQKDFLKVINNLSNDSQIMYNTHLISLFEENELDRVLLVGLNNENRTEVKSPWSNKGDIISPIRYALGVDKFMFDENTKKILFVEGVVDKFIIEGLQKTGKISEKWHIYPLFGGKDLDKDIKIKKIELLTSLMDYLSCIQKNNDDTQKNDIKYYIILDGDMKKEYENNDKISEEIKERIIYLGDENQEIEDLIDLDFYLDCVMESYQGIFADQPEKIKPIEEIIEDINEKYKNTGDNEKLTKLLKKRIQKLQAWRFFKG